MVQDASTVRIQRLLSLNWFLIVGLVLAEVLLIFKLMAKKVERSTAHLENANLRLSDSESRLQGFAAPAAHQ